MTESPSGSSSGPEPIVAVDAHAAAIAVVMQAGKPVPDLNRLEVQVRPFAY